jgi:ribosome recycling factor
MFDINNCKKEMNATINSLNEELKNIRTGRVSPDIMRSIIVDSYGSKMPITQLSNINNIDNMTLNLNIWDAGLVKSIEKSIQESNLGVTPQTDGNNILLKFPEITSERRKELVKIMAETSEKYKISIRNIRRKFIDEIKALEKNKQFSLDECKRFQDDIQKITDTSIKEIEAILLSKQSEIIKI